MQSYYNTILTSQGNGLVPFSNATINVYLTGTTTPAAIFSNNGVTAQSNPFQASVLGVVTFYAADGRYDIKISGVGFATVTVSDVLLEDPLNATSYIITGGSIDGTPIGATVKSTGGFTTTSATSILLGAGSAAAPSINWVGAATSGLYYGGAGYSIGVSFGSPVFSWNPAGVDLAGLLSFSIGGDTFLSRDSASIFAQKNVAIAQEFRVYGTTVGPKYLSLKHDGTNGIVSANSGAVLFQTSATTYGQLGSGGVWSLGGALGAESLRVTPVASAVNYVECLGGATTAPIIFRASGSDVNISSAYLTKGTGGHFFYTGVSAAQQFTIVDTPSAVNLHQFTGSATGNAINWAAAGSDANISIRVALKGTGNFLIDGGASGVSQTLQVKNTGANGAGIALLGDGVTTPNKTIRVTGGVFQILNNAFSVALLALTDAGTLSLNTNLSLSYNGTNALVVPLSGQLAFNTAAIAATATTGFHCTVSGAGAPTGVPASIPSGQIPTYYDSTNNRIYFYNGAWRSAAVA